jgi:hypothetical protein
VLPAESKAEPGETLMETSELPPPWPVPVKLIFCGLLAALSVIVTTPVRVPVTVGVKVTVIVHLLDAGTEVPQVLV